MLNFSQAPQVSGYPPLVSWALPPCTYPVPLAIHKHWWAGMKCVWSLARDPFIPGHQLRGTSMVPDSVGAGKLTLARRLGRHTCPHV